VRVVERVGRGRRQVLRLSGCVVQPQRRARGEPRCDRGLRGHLARRPPEVISRRKAKERAAWLALFLLVGRGTKSPSGGYRLPASFFRFTYAQIFLVMSDGPMGEPPNTDSMESEQPLKLIE